MRDVYSSMVECVTVVWGITAEFANMLVRQDGFLVVPSLHMVHKVLYLETIYGVNKRF